MRLTLLAAFLLLSACANHEATPHRSLLATLEQSGASDGPPPMQVDPRIPQMTKYPCARCHEKPLTALKQSKPAAHWEIKLQHAPTTFTECKTCHSETPTESLRLMNGKEVGFNNSYELCAQCHSRQAADWRGGAHGKRTSGWAAERKVLSCTGCHSPHQPRLNPRWPAMSRTHSEETP